MKKNNHTPKGKSCLVEPIRNEKDIESIKKLLSNNKRDLLLFCLSINNGLRANDILHLNVADLELVKQDETITIKERKTGKSNILCINRSVYKILRQYLEERKPEPHEYLFKSKKGNNRPLSVSTFGSMVKYWCKSINLAGNYSSHSLRKTWAYQQRVRYGTGIEILMDRFHHSSYSITRRYIGLESKEVCAALLNPI